MITLYVKKIWSLHPTQYKYITYKKAMNLYYEWIENIMKNQLLDKKDHLKTFKEWCQTEI
jgi:hypothetical protein